MFDRGLISYHIFQIKSKNKIHLFATKSGGKYNENKMNLILTLWSCLYANWNDFRLGVECLNAWNPLSIIIKHLRSRKTQIEKKTKIWKAGRKEIAHIQSIHCSRKISCVYECKCSMNTFFVCHFIWNRQKTS